MSDPTVIQIRRTIQLPDGAVRYEVTTQVTSAGDLPHLDLFVATIVDPADPKADVLARVATPHEFRQETDGIFVKVSSTDMRTIAGDPFARIASVNDLTNLPRDRATAVAHSLSNFLTSTVTLLFDSATTAEAAYRTILDRLSQLVIDFRAFRARFYTSSTPPFYAQYTLPVTGQSVESLLIDTYRTTRTARVAAETERDGIQQELDDCRATGQLDETRLGDVLADIGFLERAHDLVTAMVETGTVVGCTSGAPTIVFNNIVKTFVLNGADATSYEALLNSKRTQRASLTASVNAHRDECNAVAQRLLDNQNRVNAARQVEEAALAAVLAVCPTFTPTV